MSSLISVVMSVYDGERYLRESLESIFSQTIADFEFIVVDDGSGDATWEILNEAQKKDRRLTLVRNGTNIGLAESLNKALALVRGKYVARQDADDVSLPQRFERQIGFLKTHPDIGVLGTAVKKVDREDKEQGNYYPPEDHETILARLLINNCFRHPTLMMKASFLRQVQGYDIHAAWAEDYDLLVRLRRLTRFANLREPLVRYRTGTGFFTGQHRQQQMDTAFRISSELLRESMEGTEFPLDIYRRFWWLIQQYHLPGVIKNTDFGEQDIRELRGVVKVLMRTPAGKDVWGASLCGLSAAWGLHGKGREGNALFSLVISRLRINFGWKSLLHFFPSLFFRWMKRKLLRDLR
ncbi:MAG: glycosyltransferase [Candidatus Omnitrophica bacterium]|nr:glycosyltransferase [Candidatus Omnitrophota bacterium]